LIEWLTKLEAEDTIVCLKLVKDAKVSCDDWWFDLKDEQKKGIERGLNDIDKGRVISHDEVKLTYGL
jgi:hypothetical protein